MNYEESPDRQRRWLEDIEGKINELNTGRTIQRNRPHDIGLIKDELEFHHKNIYERNSYWENVEKLKLLETAFVLLEESENDKRSYGRSTGEVSWPQTWKTN